jgi:hypothetical protein
VTDPVDQEPPRGPNALDLIQRKQPHVYEHLVRMGRQAALAVDLECGCEVDCEPPCAQIRDRIATEAAYQLAVLWDAMMTASHLAINGAVAAARGEKSGRAHRGQPGRRPGAGPNGPAA